MSHMKTPQTSKLLILIQSHWPHKWLIALFKSGYNLKDKHDFSFQDKTQKEEEIIIV